MKDGGGTHQRHSLAQIDLGSVNIEYVVAGLQFLPYMEEILGRHCWGGCVHVYVY